PNAGPYRVRFRDLNSAATAANPSIYRVTIVRAEADFALDMKTDFVNVEQGGKSALDLTVRRIGGFNGPIDLVAEGLPSGVTLENTQIPAGKYDHKLTLVADQKTPSQPATITVTGRGDIGDKTVSHIARARHLGVDAEGVAVGEPTVEHVLLTVQHKPPFRLYCAEAYQYAHRG